jgi:WD40 repeat protein/predicted Ser/Thr protein kinase
MAKEEADGDVRDTGLDGEAVESLRIWIKGYELFEELGRGGMGVVYRARQIEARRLVALKVLDRGLVPPGDSSERFFREGRIVASLDHPGIVRLHDIGSDRGHPFFAMELIEGRSLDTVVREGPLPAEPAARILTRIARAIAYAHERKVIHRDLKPSNVIIDAKGEPHVTDFGLARRLDASAALTRTHQNLGTPAYMAPEQVSGAQGPPEPRSDIYSLGAMLYHLLTGHPPFQADTLEAILLQVVERDPVPLRRLNPNVPRDLEAICLKCLEKEPSHRYPAASALADDLDRFLDHSPVRARRLTFFHRLWRHSRRRPAIAALVATSMAAVLAGIAGVIWHWHQIEKARADTEQANARLQTLVSRLRFEHADNLARAGELRAALPHLALLLREAPLHPVTPARILSLLNSFNYFLPLSPPISVAATPNSADLSPDGRLLALTGEGRAVHVIDLERGLPVTPPLRYDKTVTRLAFSPDGRWLAASSLDGTARLWNLTNDQPVCPPIEHPGNVFFLDFAPDGRRLATTCEGRAGELPGWHWVFVWDLPDGKPACPPHTNRCWFHTVRFSPDGRLIAAASTDRNAHILEAATGRSLGMLPHDSAVVSLAFSPDGQRLATGTHDRAAQLWNVRTLEPLGPALRHGDAVASLQFSPDGEALLTASLDGCARLFDVATGQLRFSPLRIEGPLRKAVFDRAGRRIVTHGDDAVAQVWDARTGSPWAVPVKHPAPLLLAEFTPDDRRLVTVDLNGLIQVSDAQAGARQPVRLAHDEPVIRAAFGLAPDEAVAVTRSHPFVRWNVRTGQRLALGPPIERPISKALFAPNGACVLVQQSEHWAQLWDIERGRLLRPDLTLVGTETNAAFSPDGRWLALKQARVGTNALAIEVIDAATGGLLPHSLKTADRGSHTIDLQFSPDGRFLFHNELWVHGQLWQFTRTDQPSPRLPAAPEDRAAQFSPDGRRLATGGSERDAQFFDLETAAQVGPTLAHPQPVREARFTPDGKMLVTATIDNAVWVWDVASGKLRLPPMRLRGAVQRVDVSPDGRSLMILSGGAFLSVWDLATGKQRFPTVQIAGDLLIAQFIGAGQRWITVNKDGVATLRDTGTGLVMNDPFRHGAAVHDARVNADGTRLLMVGADQAVSVWEIDQVPVPAPSWLPDLAEAIAGERTDVAELMQPVPATAAYELRQRLETGGGDDFYSRWARWFFRDRGRAAEATGP